MSTPNSRPQELGVECPVMLLCDTLMPAYQHTGDAGADIYSPVDLTLPPQGGARVSSGIAIELPYGTVGFIRPRSSLWAEYKIMAEGTIDEGYRGEIHVVLNNFGHIPFDIRAGDRIAQLIVVPIVRCSFKRADELTSTPRGGGGFGSTGR